MARGTESKNQIFKKLQEMFLDSFWEDEGKILRIPMTENGECIEVKVTLTAAKTNLGVGEGVSSAFADAAPSGINPGVDMNEPTPAIQVSEEEKANVAKLLQSLNL